MIAYLRMLITCKLRKRHQYGRAQDGADMQRFKHCRLCGHEQHVKRRVRRAA